MGTALRVTGENLQKWFLLNCSFKKKEKKIAYYWNCGTFHSTLLDCIVVHISLTKEAH